MKLLLFLVACIAAGALPAQETGSTPQAPIPSATTKPTATPPAGIPTLRGKLNYKPVGRGAPAGRVDAGSRGDGDDVASLFVLAPEEVGQTARAHPRLYWFQNRAARVPCEISILKPNDPTPLLRIQRPGAAGFQRIDLEEHGVSLAPGVDYQWVVALIRDPASRSRDIISSGWIRRVESSLGQAASAETYASHSLWYDAVARLSEQIAARPGDRQLQLIRQDLLSQVGLPQLTQLASKSQD